MADEIKIRLVKANIFADSSCKAGSYNSVIMNKYYILIFGAFDLPDSLTRRKLQ
jgi:hypothetical protein